MSIRCFCRNVSILIGTILFACSPTAGAAAKAAHEVRSPDGKIAITIHTDAPLGYSITVDGKPVLLRSRLGLELADGAAAASDKDSNTPKPHATSAPWNTPPTRDVRLDA